MSEEMPIRPYSGMPKSEILSENWLGKLWDFVKANKLAGDCKTTKVSRSASGTTISSMVRGGGGVGGDGVTTVEYPYLHKINTEDEEIKNQYNFFGGVVGLGSDNIVVAPENNITVTADTWYSYFEYKLSSSTWTCSFKNASSVPDDDSANMTYYETIANITSEVIESERTITSILHYQTEGISHKALMWS